jgi:hypothetical protein
MGERELREYLDFLLRQYRLADGLWFLAVEETFGTEAAVRLNEEVWIKIAPLAAREIKSRFAIEGEGVPAVMEALSYFPWTTITGYEIKQNGDRTILRASHCPPQEARVRHGLGEFPCKARHWGEFSRFAREIDERVEVQCVMAPPDPHPGDLWCQWEFGLKANSKEDNSSNTRRKG